MTMMNALTFTPPNSTSGRPALKQIELPVPQAGSGEILVRVHYAALNNFDLETTSGERNKAVAKSLKKHPVISGIEMAGIAQSDGSRIKKGDLVFGYTNIFKGPWFHAEYVTLNESKLATVPDSFTLEGATSVIGGALTAITALEKIAKLKTGDSVLTTGATGSVGYTAVQLATHLGAKVSAVCHSSQADFARSEGAVEVYAYDKSELPNPSHQFDLIFDAAPSLSFSKTRQFLKPRGCYITTMPHLDIPGFARALFSRQKWGFLMESDTNEKRMERLRSLMAEDAFRPAVDSIHSLADAQQAFTRQQGRGKRGKILIDFR